MEYYVTIYERWAFGDKWGYRIHTNNVEALRESLKKEFNRFTITEV